MSMEIGNRRAGALDRLDRHGLAAENLSRNEKGREELTPRPEFEIVDSGPERAVHRSDSSIRVLSFFQWPPICLLIPESLMIRVALNT